LELFHPRQAETEVRVEDGDLIEDFAATAVGLFHVAFGFGFHALEQFVFHVGFKSFRGQPIGGVVWFFLDFSSPFGLLFVVSLIALLVLLHELVETAVFGRVQQVLDDGGHVAAVVAFRFVIALQGVEVVPFS
jgi:hypothetical protein